MQNKLNKKLANKKTLLAGVIAIVILISLGVVAYCTLDKQSIAIKDKKVTTKHVVKTSYKDKSTPSETLTPTITATTTPTSTPTLSPTLKPTPKPALKAIATSKPVIKETKVVVAQKQIDTAAAPVNATVATDVPKTKLVVIDAGHGGSEPGAVATVTQIITDLIAPTNTLASGATPAISPTPITSAREVQTTFYEKDLNLYMANQLNSILRANGVDTYMIRTGDTYSNYKDRPGIANSKKAAIYVSIHCNSSTSATLNGTETYYYNNYTLGSINTSQFASIVQSNLVASLGLTNNGVRNNQAFTVITKTTDMLAVLVEVGYMSNKSDMDKLITSEFKNTAARSLANSIINALGKI